MKYAFLMPIGNSISGKLVPQLLNLYNYIKQIDGYLFTVSNRTHVDARNFLITNGQGFINPTKLINEVDWLVWIDSDQVFNLSQVKILLDCKELFCCGWYIKDLNGSRNSLAMVAEWDEEYFKKYHTMRFLHENELLNSKNELRQVDYCGFGFTKVHTSLVKKMEYPYFRQNLQKIGKYQDNSSEDTSFCLDLHKATGIKPKVITKLKVGHLKEIIL